MKRWPEVSYHLFVIKGGRVPQDHMWCDQVKWVWNQKIWFLFFWHFLLGYCLGFNLVETPQRLDNWFQRYKQLKDWTNNKKQKKLSALFGCILKTVFASSDAFCLIALHISPFAISDYDALWIISRWLKINSRRLVYFCNAVNFAASTKMSVTWVLQTVWSLVHS